MSNNDKKYNSQMPRVFKSHIDGGGSIGSFCKKVSINRSTFYAWCAYNPEFDEVWRYYQRKRDQRFGRVY